MGSASLFQFIPKVFSMGFKDLFHLLFVLSIVAYIMRSLHINLIDAASLALFCAQGHL